MEPVTPEGAQPTQETIEGPEYLEKGQNFFDQGPFTAYGQELIDAGIDPEILRRALVDRARRWYTHTNEKDWNKMPEFDPSETQSFRDRLLLRRIEGLGVRGQKAFKVAWAVREVEKYPLVLEYIQSKRAHVLYGASGAANPNATDQAFQLDRPRSYGAWLSVQQASAIREISHGLDEVFPDQPPLSIGERVADAKPATRRWVILKQAELVQTK